MIPNSSNWIVSIGVNFSQSHEHLSCSHFDAIDVFNVLKGNWDCKSDKSILLIDKDATTGNVNIALNEILLRLADENDRIFIYLSGHIDTNVRSITGSFITCDYCKEKHNFGLNLRSLRYIVEDSRAKYIVVIIDGCSSGIIAQGHKVNTPHWFYFTTGEMDSQISTKLFVTAVSSGRDAYEHKKKRNSEFTGIFLDTISPFINHNKSLSTSLFYELLAKKAREQGIEPVKSGIEIGHSTFINSDGNYQSLTPENTNSYLPDWIVNILKDCRNSNSLLENDKSSFVKDNNYPDGSRLKIGQVIKKSWRIRNTGSIIWKNRFIKMIGESRGAGRIHCDKITPIPNTEPNQEIDIEIELRMPPHPCSVYAEFKIIDSSGNILFPNQRGLYVTFDIIEESEQKLNKISSDIKNSGCFISSVYGDMYASEVKILNSFKDNAVMKSRLGAQFVHLYYSNYGKKCFFLFEKHFPFMIDLVRKLLDKLINLIIIRYENTDRKNVK